jgi:hypothetical protein
MIKNLKKRHLFVYKPILLFLLFLLAGKANAGIYYDFLVKDEPGLNHDNQKILADNNGNLYSLSNFGRPQTFDNGTTMNLQASDPAELHLRNGFLAKFSADGNTIWAVHFKSGGTISLYDMVIDKNGHINVLLSYRVNITVGSFSKNGGETLLMKFDQNGNLLSSEVLCTNPDSLELNRQGGLAIDNTGNIYIAVKLRAGVITIKGVSYTPTTVNELILSRINTTGTCDYITPIGKNTYLSEIAGMVVENNKILIHLSLNYTFNAQIGSETFVSTSNLTRNSVIMNANTSGSINWVKRIGVDGNVFIGNGIAVDNAGKIYFTGAFENSLTLNGSTITSNGGQDIAIAALNSDGSLYRLSGYGTELNETGNDIHFNKISGEIYFMGKYVGNNTRVFNFGGFQLKSGYVPVSGYPYAYNDFTAILNTTGTITDASDYGISGYYTFSNLTSDASGRQYVSATSDYALIFNCQAFPIYTDGNTINCASGTEKLAAPNIAGATYQWKKNGTSITNATRISFDATETGNYTVEVQLPGCTVTSQAKSVVFYAKPHISVSSPLTAEGAIPFQMRAGYSLYFDGFTSYISIPDFSIPEGPVTIEYWIKPENNSFPDQNTELIKIGDQGITISSYETGFSNTFGFSYGNGTRSRATYVNYNEWNHVAIFFTGKTGTAYVYINGKLNSSFNISASSAGALTGLTIGGSGQSKFKGYLHDLRIWKYWRSESEIYQNMEILADYSSPILAGAWRLNEGSGSQAIDYSAGKKNSYLFNCTWKNIGSGNTYQWSASSPPYTITTPGSTSQMFNTSLNIPGNYRFVLTVSNPSAGAACSTTVTVPVNVTPRKGAMLSYPIQAGTITSSAIYINTQDNTASNGFLNDLGQPSDDIYYRFTVPVQSNIMVSTCGGTTMDSYLHLLDASGNVLASNDDNGTDCYSGQASIYKLLDPGTYYAVAEGYYTNTGPITVTIRSFGSGTGSCTAPAGATRDNPINVTVAPGCFYFSNTLNNSTPYCFGNEYGQGSDDIFYKLVLNETRTMKFSTCNSIFTDTYLSLLDGSGALLESCDDNGPLCTSLSASIVRQLSAGTYYLVVEGYGTKSGSIKTEISTSETCPRLSEEDAADSESISSAVNVYPNPVSEGYTNLYIAGISAPAEVKITDVTGRIASQFTAVSETTEINLSYLNSGIYFLSFTYNGKVVVKQVTVAH